MRNQPDNKKDGFEGYAIESNLQEHEDGVNPLVLHDTLACKQLKEKDTITVWTDNIDDNPALYSVYLHRCAT